MNNFLLSVIVPVFNEKNNIQPLITRLLPIISIYQYELIFVNDGSVDPTPNIIKEEAKKNKNIKLISFQRNFGHQIALTAGYQNAKGNCVITLDSDLQDPPEIIKDMIIKWQKGAKIVYAQRKKREVDSFLKKFTAQFFYKFINFLSDTHIPDDVGDFRLLDRIVVDFINNLHEQSRFLRGLVAWGGFPAQYVFFDREKRFSGETHYPFSKMLNFALEGIVSFSTKPLLLASYLGFITGSIGFLGIIYAIVGKLFFTGYWVTGWTALFVGIMFLGGVQLITIGIIGEYIGKIYQEVQKKPLFLIKETVNI
ncbi:glycosyltransferase family 2 protein [Candidatus Roizmanbacteria bacterium]|nr:glycosyltransferase family 2 protein [Candidatus Roizmanbacteria bacterium]